MFPDEPNDEERQEQLPEDGDTPFRPADAELDDTVRSEAGGAALQHLNSTHPATDTGLQPEDIYENGVAGAADATDPNADSAVTGYKGVPNPMVEDDSYETYTDG